MEATEVVLFLHIAFVIVGLMMAAVLHASLALMRRATTVAQLRPWPPVIHRLEPLLPLAAVGILATGLWLIRISDGEFRIGEGWVLVSLVALVVVEGVGGLVSRRSKELQLAIRTAPDGPVPPRLRRPEPALWYTAHFGTAVFFGIIFLMVVKPSAVWSMVVVLVAAILGLASTVPFVRTNGRSQTVDVPPAGRVPNKRRTMAR